MRGVKDVLIRSEQRRSNNSTKSSYTVYKVSITLGNDTVNIAVYKDYLKSRKIAEKTARFLQKSLNDNGLGTPMTRDWDKLDESLRDRIRRGDKISNLLKIPKDSKIKVKELHSSITIEIPGGDIDISAVIILVLIFVPLIFFFVPFISVIMKSPKPLTAMQPLMVFALFIISVIIVQFKKSGGFYTQDLKIEVNRDELLIIKGKKKYSFKVSKIEDIAVRYSVIYRSIITDEKILRFGDSLKQNEIIFIKNKILSKICS